MNPMCLLWGLLLFTLPSVFCFPPPCDSDIYCYGPLLHTVQMSHLYNDSKYFVDMKLKNPPNETMKAFLDFMKRYNQKPIETEVQKFVDEMFEPPGTEFEQWNPKDWTSDPKFLSKIKDPFYRKWAQDLNLFWKQLGKKMKDEVHEHQEMYSIIYVPNPVIVPGGRFREFYYWDSYWIVQGLLLSEMNLTVKGMLENFLHMVKTYGFIPNGGRIYYLRRSQPPLLIPTVKTYIDKTNDEQFLKENIDMLEAEFMFWMNNHTVTVEKDNKLYVLARYYAPSDGPRPESYREDYKHTDILKTPAEKQYRYIQLKTAAESGWDFSTRWFIVNGTNKGHITDTKTQHIIPVELNAILQRNAQLLSEFYDKLNNPVKSAQFKHLADQWLDAVTDVLWNEEVGAWLDYDTLNNVQRNYFYPTNLSPLWTGCYRKDGFNVNKIMKYLENVDILRNLGGIPTSTEHSGEQWDYPNAWPPLQYIVIMALDNTNDPWARDLAFELAERWVRSNFKAYNESQAMYEKYDARMPGGYGTGGEYVNQVGFGWTNGVILELLDKYGSHLSVRDSFFSDSHKYDIVEDNSAHGLHCTVVLLVISFCGAIFL